MESIGIVHNTRTTRRDIRPAPNTTGVFTMEPLYEESDHVRTHSIVGKRTSGFREVLLDKLSDLRTIILKHNARTFVLSIESV